MGFNKVGIFLVAFLRGILCSAFCTFFSFYHCTVGLSMLQLRRHHRRGNGASEKKNIFLLFKDLFAGKEVLFPQSCRWLLLPTLDLTASTFPGRSTRRGRGRGSNSILGATCIHFPAQREREKLVVFLLSCFVCKKYFLRMLAKERAYTEMPVPPFLLFYFLCFRAIPNNCCLFPPKSK